MNLRLGGGSQPDAEWNTRPSVPLPFIRKQKPDWWSFRLLRRFKQTQFAHYTCVWHQASRSLAENLRNLTWNCSKPTSCGGKWHNNCTHVRCTVRPLPFIQISFLACAAGALSSGSAGLKAWLPRVTLALYWWTRFQTYALMLHMNLPIALQTALWSSYGFLSQLCLSHSCNMIYYNWDLITVYFFKLRLFILPLRLYFLIIATFSHSCAMFCNGDYLSGIAPF